MRDGFRPQERGEEAERGSENTNEKRDFIGNKKMRPCLCKLPQDKNFFDKKIRVCKTLEYKKIEELSKLNTENAEGFVIYYPKADLRLKVKFEEYVRLHKIVTGLSVKGVWEYMQEHGVECDVMKMAEDAPDEFHEWLKKINVEILLAFNAIAERACLDFVECSKPTHGDRKGFALLAQKTKYPGLLFAMLDDKDWKKGVWKMIKPKAHETFKVNQ